MRSLGEALARFGGQRYDVLSSARPLRFKMCACDPVTRGALIALLVTTCALGQNRAENAGERLFESYCSACHQYDDQGMGEAPPLENSPWVTGPAERLVRVLLHGVTGRIEIGGRVYDREMPGFGGVLSDEEAAKLATYTRSRFGADDATVTANEVARIRREHADRTKYWSADELLRLR